MRTKEYIMKINWLLEADIFGDDAQDLMTEIEKQGHTLKVLSNNWDTKWLNLFNPKDCVIYYGGLELGYCIRREAPWVPGIYASIENYVCTKYYPLFGKYLLNQNYIMIPYGELLRQKDFLYDKLGMDKYIFIRPNKGNKVFTGTLIYYKRFEKDIDIIGHNIQPDELCVVCEPRNVEKEWRFLIVDNQIVTGSEYKPGLHRVEGQSIHSDDAIAYRVARDIIEEVDYIPDRCWTMDICKTREGGFSLLEVGSFSCAGLYAMDMERVVTHVSRAAMEDWQEIYLTCSKSKV